MKNNSIYSVFKLFFLTFVLFAISNIVFAATAQTIFIDMTTPANAINGSTFSVGSISSSGLDVSVTVTGGCSTVTPVLINNGTVTMTSDSVSCVVHYNQAGDGTFDPATEITETVLALPSNNVVTSTPGAPEVVVTNPTQTVTVTVDSSTTNATLNVSSFISSGTGTLPEINITSANANNTKVEIPASTVVTSADNTWNGIMAVPTVTTVSLPPVQGETKTLSTAIEVGFSGAKLSFSKAVRLLLSNQAGKRAGYIRTGIDFTEITNTCASDDQATGDALGADSECKIDVGSDLVIWTKHFTSFATYTQTVNRNNGGGAALFNNVVNNNPAITPVVAKVDVVEAGKVLGAQTFNFTSNLKKGAKGNEVTELQKFLNAKGYDVGKADGVFGLKTKKAVLKFQIDNKILNGYGTVGPLTRALINKK